MALVDASTVVFASPTVLTGPHPSLAYAAILANALAPKTRFAAMIGSYGWGTTMPDLLREMLREFKAEFFEPVLTKGAPNAETFAALDALAEFDRRRQRRAGDARRAGARRVTRRRSAPIPCRWSASEPRSVGFHRIRHHDFLADDFARPGFRRSIG